MDVAIAVSFKNVLYLRKKRRMDQAEVSGPDSACKGEEPNSSEQEAVSRDCKGTMHEHLPFPPSLGILIFPSPVWEASNPPHPGELRL